MPVIFPIPTSRSSDQLAQTRLLAQMQTDTLELLRLQGQVSTGRRISLPSEDAPAAQRAVVLQRMLELKTQVRTNLNSTRSYAEATDSATASVSGLLVEIKATAIGATSNTISATTRAAAVNEIRTAVNRLAEVGNQQFRDRYLFGGSRTTDPPYTTVGSGYVAYEGNEGSLRSYADINVLYDANLSGAEVFGAYSSNVRGSVDLNPVLQPSTLLSDLHGGFGVAEGSFSITDGTNTSVIDISGAETIEDVTALIMANPPAGRTIFARVSPNGIELELDAAGGGDLIVREVGGGTIAAQLGILHTTAAGTGPFAGADLNPRLKLTTSLADALGVRARAVIESAGSHNNIVLEATGNGSASNGVTVQFVDDALLHASGGLLPGNETVTYNASPTAARAAVSFSGAGNDLILTATAAGTAFNGVTIEITNAGPIGNAANVSYDSIGKKLTIGVDSTGATQIQTVINALAAEGTFTAVHDASDVDDGAFVGTAAVSPLDAGAVFGNTGNSGGAARTIFVGIAPGGSTAAHIVSALNDDPAVAAEFTARIEASDTRIPILAGLSGVDLNATAVTSLGAGENLDTVAGLQIVNGGETYNIDLSGISTVEDLLNALNGSGAYVSATLKADGSGIDLRSRLSGGDFSVGENGGTTATQLGLRSFATSTTLAELNFGRGVGTIAGTDFSIRRRDGVTLDIDVSSAVTVQDVLNAINNHASNLNPANRVVARLATSGNGIELVDANAAGTDTLTVTRTFGSSAAIDLGLIPKGSDQATGAASGANQILSGRDVNPLEVDGVFNTLIRLADAIENQDFGEVQRLTERIDADLDRVNFARTDLAHRTRALDSIEQRLEDEEVQLKDGLSKEIEVDLVEAISQLTARQASLQASLQLAGRTFQITLLDFI